MSVEVLDFEPPRGWAAASVVGGLVFLAGEGGTDQTTMELVPGGAEAQTEQAFDNITATLGRLGLGLDALVRLTVYVTDMALLPRVASVIERRLPRPLPSTAVGVVALAHPGLVVEIDAIASLTAVGARA